MGKRDGSEAHEQEGTTGIDAANIDGSVSNWFGGRISSMSAHAIYVLSVFLHIAAAIVWLGGMLFLVLVIMPALRGPGFRDTRSSLVTAVGKAFRPIGWACLATLVVTGFINLHLRGMLSVFSETSFWRGSFGQVLAAKLVVVAALLVLSAAHDFWVGPKAVCAAEQSAGSADHVRWRQCAAWMGRLTALLALLAVLLGVLLVRGRPW